jgi:hypothetical protein
LTGDLPGQGDRVFARLENAAGDIQNGISTAMLVPAADGRLRTIMPIGFRLESGRIVCPLCHAIVAPRLDAVPLCARCGGSADAFGGITLV